MGMSAHRPTDNSSSGGSDSSSGDRTISATATGAADQVVRLRYQNTRMYRIIPGFMCQGGDFNFGNGGMGESIYGQFMRNERFAFSHSKRGVLSMADAGWEHSNNSNFFITFGPQKHLDSKHVAFGAIEHGME
ncbi:hypothetical protein FOZ63_010319, partial [Perkinsus olseni]